MKNIEELATLTYKKNINFLHSKNKELVKMLDILEVAIEKGDYTPQYDLEYLDGYFDVINLNTKQYLYNTNSSEISKQLAKQNNDRKNAFTFEGFPVYNFTDKQVENFDDYSKSMAGIMPLMKYYSQNMSNTQSMKETAKYIFIGVGLGMHIPLIHEIVSAGQYLIIEDSLELFKLSLFTTPYYEIAKKSTLYFAIADDESSFPKTMDAFLTEDFFSNRYLKYSHFPMHSNHKFKQIQNGLITQSFIFFPYGTELKKFLKPFEYLNDGYKILNLSRSFPDKSFEDKPFLVVAAGPSLAKNIEWLKKNQDKFILIAASATLVTLQKNNITPDIVTQLDGSPQTKLFFTNLTDLDFLKNCIFIFGSNVTSYTRELFNKEQIYYYQETAEYVQGFNAPDSPCIGSANLMISLIFNAKSVYLLGLDLAVNQETGETHSGAHIENTKNNMQEKDKVSDTMDHVKNLFPIKGNFTQTVYTNSVFHSSVKSLDKLLPRVKQENQKIYNLNDGAFINYSIAKQIKDINTEYFQEIDKTNLKADIANALSGSFALELSSSDIVMMKERLENAKETYKLLLDYKNSVSHSNSDKYLYDLLGLVSLLLKKQSRSSMNLSYIYFNFFKYSLSLIIDFFNTKELKNEKRHIKKLDKMLQDEMFNICGIYKDTLEDFINRRC